jgi:hypothetical protein
MLRKVMHLFAIGLSSAAFSASANDMPLGNSAPGGSPHAGAVARTVRSLVEYTRWPQPPSPVEVCTAGPAGHAELIDQTRLADGRVLRRRSVAASASALAGCDVLYLGKLPIQSQQQLVAAVRGRGVLTVAEADPACQSEAMFCLLFQPKGLSFRLNIDAVSRSGLRVDPRVLRVSQGAR